MAQQTSEDRPADVVDRAVQERRPGVGGGAEELGQSFWRDTLAPYARPDTGRALWGVATSAGAYLVVTALMYAALDVSAWLTLALALPATGFLVRTFIVFHDCTHGSYLPSRRANAWLGVTCGVLVYTPFHLWRHEHAVHHATAGDLDRRGKGDVETLTVPSTRLARAAGRLGYRLVRNPLVMLGLGPLWAMILEPRLIPRWARTRFGRTIVATDVALVALLGGLCALFGWHAVLFVQLVPALPRGRRRHLHVLRPAPVRRRVLGAQGAVELRRGRAERQLLPAAAAALQWFTGNIGLHHVHHLHARIPNYNLQRAHDENPIFLRARQLNALEALLAMRLKLYDERSRSLVGFAGARA